MKADKTNRWKVTMYSTEIK